MQEIQNISPELAAATRKNRNFKERHPFIFWVGVLVVGLIIFSVFRNVAEKLISGESSKDNKVAVVRVEGFIFDTRGVLDWIETVRKDPAIKAVILRVDSPGGGVAASEEIYSAIRRLDRSKPVVASMGSLAASGGLFVSMGARKIVSNSTTLTGSIGVKMELPNLEGLMDKIGVSSQTLVTGGLKDAGSMYRSMTPEEKKYLMGIMTDMNKRFIEVIAESRALSLDKVEAIADGRALTGREAHKLGLVDAIGDFGVAVELLKEVAHLPDTDVKLLERPQEGSALIREMLRSYLGISVESPKGIAYRFYY